MVDSERKVVVITGAAGGIGLAIGRAFASSGFCVVLSDIDQSRLDSAVDSARSRGSEVLGVRCDVRSADSMLALRDATLDRFGTVDVVCLNAGSVTPRSTLEVTSADWERGLAVNLFGVVNGVQAFLPVLEESGGGHINATSSMSGLVPFPPVVTYNVAKAGVIAYMETLARELRSAGSLVGVSVFCPGEVATGAIENSMRQARADGYAPTPEEADSAVAAQEGLLSSGIDPDEAGRLVVKGIEEGRFWIFSHPAWVEGPLKQLQQAIVTDGSLPNL